MNWRNMEEVVSQQGGIIDQGSLWTESETTPGLLILVDDDDHHTMIMDASLFEEA